MSSATLGAEGATARLTLEGEGGVRRDIEVPRRMSNYQALREKDGPVYRKLDDQTGYVDLVRLENAQVDAMFTEFKDT